MLISKKPFNYFDPEHHNRTTQYLTYLSGFNIVTLQNYGFIQTYLHQSSLDEDLDQLCLLFKNPPSKIIETLKNKHIIDIVEYQKKIKDSDQVETYQMITINLSDNLLAKEVLKKFKAGKYSEFPKEYKDQWFDKKIPTKEMRINSHVKKFFIVNKDSRYKKLLVDHYGVKESSIGELDSIPALSEEIFMYCDSDKYKVNPSCGMTLYDRVVEDILIKSEELLEYTKSLGPEKWIKPSDLDNDGIKIIPEF